MRRIVNFYGTRPPDAKMLVIMALIYTHEEGILGQRIHSADTYDFLPAVPTTLPGSRFSRLHLQQHTEQRLGRLCKKLDLGIGMQAVQIRGLRGQGLVYVLVVALVVGVGRHREAGGQVELAVKLKAHTTSVLVALRSTDLFQFYQ